MVLGSGSFLRVALPFGFGASLLLVGACRPPAPAPAPSPDDESGRTGGELVFEATFEQAELGDDWKSEGAAWTLVDGELRIANARNDALWLQRPLPERFRVEFDARALSDVGDLKFEIAGDGANHESGYIGIFGGWNNRLNIIARLDEHGDDRLVGAEDMRVEPERTYRMAVVRTDQRLRWYIDGEPFLTYDDPAPLQGETHRHFGFNNWEAPAAFDNLQVWDLGGP